MAKQHRALQRQPSTDKEGRDMRFERVSLSAFMDDVRKHYSESMRAEDIMAAWNNIKIPERKTKYSAGYDICCPLDISIGPHSKIVVPTGIRAVFAPEEMESWHLQMYVRSSVGIKDEVMLSNNTGVIDPDYFQGLNEGDMMLALFNTGDNLVQYKAGDRLCQAVFVLHGITIDDKATGQRIGGLGSTNT